MAIDITDDQANKIRFIQDCIRSQRTGQPMMNNMKIRAAKAAELREKYGNNTIVLFAVGDSYEAYNDSAEALHDICKQPLFFMGNISSTDFRKKCADWIYPKMIKEGYKICILENGQY